MISPFIAPSAREARWAMAGKVATYRAQDYTKFQLKVGGAAETDIERIFAVSEKLNPGDVLIADANAGRPMHQAARVIDAVKALDVYIEQPCASDDECLSIRAGQRAPSSSMKASTASPWCRVAIGTRCWMSSPWISPRLTASQGHDRFATFTSLAACRHRPAQALASRHAPTSSVRRSCRSTVSGGVAGPPET
jgi:hypothetical protein